MLLSREGSLLCYTCYDMDPWIIWSLQKRCPIIWPLTISQGYSPIQPISPHRESLNLEIFLFAELMVDFVLWIINFGFCFLLTAESQVGYTPWGRPGAGAPLRTRSGKLAADYRARQVFKCSNGRMMYMDWGACYVSLWSHYREGEHNDSILKTKKGWSQYLQ